MLDNRKIASFIAIKRKEQGLTQQQIADRLNVSFQAVSKWENGITYPNTELLVDLAQMLGVSVDNLLLGNEKSEDRLTYSKAGIDISYTDAIKSEMSKYLNTSDKRVLNGLGPFASLYDINYPSIKEPVLVLKSEEPGSKQKLAMEYGYSESICHDMINHLVNDIIVMGAKPLAVLDTIVCGSAEKDTIKSIVKGISEACRENECSLVGGETSIQPQFIDKGVYILTSCIAGIADKKDIVDGSKIEESNIVLAVASNGLHTNGYSLIRLLMDKMPQIKLDKIDRETFIEQIMKPHIPYYKSLKDLFGKDLINGMAHITGGGIEGNLCRVIPNELCAEIDLSKINTLPLFKYIKMNGNIQDDEMLSTFNCGVGFIVVASKENVSAVQRHINKFYNCYVIGKIVKGIKKIQFIDNMIW